MGNHDERAAYARGLFDSDDDGAQDRVHEVDGLRIVALDTSVPGYHHGELRPEQLAWLADVLATPAEHGTLLAMHHPPLPLPMLRAAELIELLDQRAPRRRDRGHRRARDPRRPPALLDVVDVRRRPGLGRLGELLHHRPGAGRPLRVRRRRRQAFTMVHAYDDRLVHTLVPLERGPEVSGVGLDIVEALEGLSVEEARELASNKTSPFNS